MKKSYCDNCGVEITPDNVFSEIEVEVSEVKFYLAFPDCVPCDFDVCKYCVLDAVAKEDDRPKVEVIEARDK